MMKSLNKLELESKIIKMMKRVHTHTRKKAKFNHETLKAFLSNSGTRQENILCPLHFHSLLNW